MSIVSPNEISLCQARWYTGVIPALVKLRQEPLPAPPPPTVSVRSP